MQSVGYNILLFWIVETTRVVKCNGGKSSYYVTCGLLNTIVHVKHANASTMHSFHSREIYHKITSNLCGMMCR